MTQKLAPLALTIGLVLVAGLASPDPIAQKKKKSKKESDYFSAHDPVATAKKKAAKAGSKSAAKN